MATFLVVHGAWTGSWFWRKLRPLLRDLGHDVFTPTLTGVGERLHLAHPDIDLDTHINDILQVLHFEDLTDVVLLGHSYGGMVATGVADRAPERIAQVIYLDAFVPRDGDSVLSLLPAQERARRLEAIRQHDEEWRVPPNPMPPDTAEQDIDWAVPRRMGQPLKTFQQPIQLSGAINRLRKTYIYCTRPGPGDAFRQFADRARSDQSWRYIEVDASHNPHVTMPDGLARILDQLARAA